MFACAVLGRLNAVEFGILNYLVQKFVHLTLFLESLFKFQLSVFRPLN